MIDKSRKLWADGTDFSAIQYIGERASQEDYSQFRLFPADSGLLAILADGMGGHTSGEVASNTAVNAFDSLFKSYSISSPVPKLAASLSGANAELAKVIVQNPQLKGMGCTLIAVYLNKSGMYWISVGDSLIYLFRDGKLNQLNQDHSMAPLIEESYKAGKLSKQEADNYPNKNALRSALMGDEIPLIDAPDRPIQLYQNDVVIIASDGILSLNNNEIRDIVEKSLGDSAELTTNNLIKAVKLKNRKNQDNTTIQVIKASHLYPNRINRKLFARVFLLVSVLLIISLGVVYHQKLYDLFGPALGFKQQLSDEIKPLAIPANIDIKDEPIAAENNKKNSIGGGLDLHKNQKDIKKKDDPKKLDKKSPDEKVNKNNQKDGLSPSPKLDGKGGLGGDLKPESRDELDKKPKDQIDPKSVEKSESTKI